MTRPRVPRLPSGSVELKDFMEENGFAVAEAGDAEAAAHWMASRSPDLIISDMRLPGETGLSLLDYSRQLPVPPAFLVITAFGTVEQAVNALQRGADDFLTKPLSLDHLRLRVERALERRALQSEIYRYRQMLKSGDFHGLIGRSVPMRQLFEQIRRA